MLGNSRFLALIFLFSFSILLFAGCGRETPPPRVETLTDVSVQCPSCEYRFSRTLAEVKESIQQKGEEKTYCPACGIGFDLSEKNCHRYGNPIKSISIAYKLTEPDGSLRTPFTVEEEGGTFDMIGEYNKLEGAVFDRLRQVDIALVAGKEVPRGPFSAVDPLAGSTIKEVAPSPEKPLPVQGPWFFEPSWPDKDGVQQGIADASEEIGGSKMYCFDHNTDAYNKQIEASGETEDMKKMLSQSCMKEVALYIMQAEKFWPSRPSVKFGLEGVSTQDTVLRVPNADRDNQLDDNGNPVRYKFHEDRDTLAYNDNGSSWKFVETLRERFAASFGPVIRPDFWKADYNDEELPYKFWDHAEYISDSEQFATQKNIPEGKMSFLAKLLVEHKDADEAWKTLTANVVVRSTDLLKWVDERTKDLAWDELPVLSNVDGILNGVFANREKERNMFFCDSDRSEKKPAPQSEQPEQPKQPVEPEKK